jgi:signal transduction histidine kinase
VAEEQALSTDDAVLVLSTLRDMARASIALVPERIVGNLIRICVEVTQSDRGALYLLDEKREVLSVVGTWPPDDELGRAVRTIDVKSSRTGQQMLSGRAAGFSVAKTNAPRAVVDAGVKHWATVPLPSRGRVAGVLNIGRIRDVEFTPRELRLAEMVAEVLVINVENARLHDEAQRQLDETNMLLDVGRALSASLDLEGILDTAVDKLARIVSASKASVLLLGEGDAYLRGVASSPQELRDFMRTVRIDMTTRCPSTRAVMERRAVPVEDVEKITEIRRDLAVQLGLKSILVTPLLTRDRAIGVIVLGETRGPRRWTPQEIRLTELVGHQLGAAIANARLFAEVKRRNEQLAGAHQQMVERERLAALGQFAATLAHEIRNPLGVLFNSVGALTKRTSPDGEEASLLAIMGEEARRLDRLVRELLEFARPRAPELQICALAPVVNGAIDAASTELVPPPKSIVVDIASEIAEVEIDPFMLRQALFNLALNAGQAAGPDGNIVLRARVDEQTKLRIEITDDGPGISREHVERIFEPFFTTKPKGTGLGLVIVKSIVDVHNGELHVSTAASGRGTTVSIVLPLRAHFV